MSVLTQSPVNINTSGWTAITVQSSLCTSIRICEVDQAGTTDYKLAAPDSTSGPKTIPAGKEYQLNGYFIKGQIVCYLQAVSGSVNFDIIEDGVPPSGTSVH